MCVDDYCSPVDLNIKLANSSLKPTCQLESSLVSNSSILVGHPPPELAFYTSATAAIADTGSTAHFCTIDAPVINARPATTPITIRNPDGAIMVSTHVAELDLPNLPDAARHVHLVPALAGASLISIGQLCDSGCSVTLDATSIHIAYDNKVVLAGTRTPTTRLWHLDLNPSSPVSHESHAAVGSATPAEIVAFMHAALFSPALSTLDLAFSKGYLPNLPGLTQKLLRKHPPHSIPMIKGHLDQARQNQRSTQPQPPPPPTWDLPTTPLSDDALSDSFPSSDSPNDRSRQCYAAMFEPTGRIFSDQTGRFVAPSSHGNNYLLLLYDYDSNCILAEPIKTRSGPSILAGFKILHARLCAAGHRPQLQRLDNECSEPLKDFLRSENIDFQLAPPGIHRRNAAERAIRTFKNHFIAGLCSVDKAFPLHLWDRLVPQAVLTLNLLRGSRLNPNLSAWAQLHGLFDFNRTPLAPPGIRVLVHEKPHARDSTWSPHAVDGWYVGPALDSYRCYRIWVWDTRAERISDTVSWFPTKVTLPLASSTDLILAGIQDIVHALNNPSPGSPLAPLTDGHVAALQNLTELLTNIVTPAPVDLLPLLPGPAPPAPVLIVPPAALPAPAPLLRVDAPVPEAPHVRFGLPDQVRLIPARPPRRAPAAATTSDMRTMWPHRRAPAAETTYDMSTGPIGRRHRRNNRRNQPRRPHQPPSDTENSLPLARHRPPPTTTVHTENIPDLPVPPTDAAPLRPTVPQPPPTGTASLSPPDNFQTPPSDTSQTLTSAPLLTPALPADAAAPSLSPPPAPPSDNNNAPAPTPRHRHQHNTRANNRRAKKHFAASASAPSTPLFEDHYALHGNAFNPDTGLIADYLELSRCSEGALWIESCKDEFGRLCQGHGTAMPTGTNTMFFIPVQDIPKGKKATYLRIVAAFRPEKANPRRVRFTVGGDRISYDGIVSTKTADLTTVKTLLNSVISTPNARFMTADLKDFYLETPMEVYEYMRIPVAIIPDEIMLQYHLAPLIHRDHVYVEIRKGMYGLPQAGKIANDRLISFLAPHGYSPVPITPGLWKHAQRDIVFSLVVDDFGVKYTNLADAQHLMATLKLQYTASEDWEGLKYCGLTLTWDYINRTVDLSMPGYIERALQRFQHPAPTRAQHAPHTWIKPQYGAITQYAPSPDTSPALDVKDKLRVQEVLGVLLYYGRAVDSTILTAINTLASQQANATKETMKAITHLLNYCATHPDAVV